MSKAIESGAPFQQFKEMAESSPVGMDGHDQRYSHFPQSKRVSRWPWRWLARLHRDSHRVKLGQVF